MLKDDVNFRHYVAYAGRVVGVSNKVRPVTEKIEVEPTLAELSRAKNCRMDLGEKASVYVVTYRGTIIRSGLKRGAARELLSQIFDDPTLFVKRKAELSGVHAARVWTEYLTQKAIASAKRDAALHGPCRCYDAAGNLVRILPPNSSNPQRKSLETKLRERRGRADWSDMRWRIEAAE